MYTLYIANKNYSSWSLRPWVLMQELGIEFEERLVPFKDGSNWDVFRTFCPSGKVPCLISGELVVWDSLAIMEYLAENHDGVWPAEIEQRAWARCVSAEMHSGFDSLRQNCGMNVGLRIRLNEIGKPLQRDIQRIDELWVEGLNRFGGPFLTGEKFSAVDAFFTPVAFRVQTYGLSMSKAAGNYVERLLYLESMKDWSAMALKEEWRDLSHEKEAAAFGEVLSDYRLVSPG